MSRTTSIPAPLRAAAAAAALAILGTTASATTAAPAAAATAGDYRFTDRVAAYGRNVHRLDIGAYDDYVVVRGDQDTDLDCWIYDARGRLVSSDTDETDVCVLATPGVGRHRLVVRNLGGIYNQYTVVTGSD